jgi:D-alanyl-D-alanine carboxypeptidase
MNRKTIVALALVIFVSLTRAQDSAMSMRSAVELSIPTSAGFGYRILEADALGSWRAVGPQIFGNGLVITQQLSAPAPAHFYRTESFAIQNLNATLETIRAKRGLPALACAVVLDDRIVGLGAVGARKNGVTNAPVTTNDKWHIGSLTKSMTATLAAMMVEEGRIKWTTTLADVFPELASRMHPDWLKANLEQLTSNRGGAPNGVPTTMWNEFIAFGGTPPDARHLLLQRVTAAPPSSTPGTRYEYSNFGFSIAGHMLETIAGKPWEELITSRLFQPLGMSSTAFGAPAASRMLDQPLGHQLAVSTNPPSATNPMTWIDAGPPADNPPAIGPAGILHSSIIDLAAYAAFQIRARKGQSPLISKTTAEKLQTAYPNNGNYAHGWGVFPRAWANGNALNHTGTNGQWYSTYWIAPDRNFAVIIVCNLGGDTAFWANDDVASAMVGQFLK